MAKDDKIKISVKEEISNVARSMEKVTKAVFSGAPGTAAQVKAKRKSAQFSFKLKDASKKNEIITAAEKKMMDRVFREKAVQLEKEIKSAMENVIMGLIGLGSPSISVFGDSLGIAKDRTDITNEPFAKFIKSPAGAGEIGLPDPDEALRNLKIALSQAIRVDVIVRSKGPQVKMIFDQRKLLTLTPHPSRLEGGAPAPFFSWLSLVTGPDFASGGTPGYALVRASDIKRELNKMSSKASGAANKAAQNRGVKRVNKLKSLLQVSRTRNNAGEYAGLMLSTTPGKGGRSPAEVLGGISSSYRPNRKFDGFWDKYWLNMKLDLGEWASKVMIAAVRALAGGG